VSSWESGRTLEKEVSLDIREGERLLEKGEHRYVRYRSPTGLLTDRSKPDRFAFAIVVPSSTAPFDRCQYGRVYHRVYGMAKLGGAVGTKLEDETGWGLLVNPAG
jgi:hypothetical protein